MKIHLLLLFMCCTGLYATNAYSQDTKVTIVKHSVTLKEILYEIEEKTDYLFLYNQEEVDLTRKVSLKAKNKWLSDVLSDLFGNTDVRYVVEGNNIVLMKQTALQSAVTQQDTRLVTGTVTDENGETVIGVNVLEKGTANGTITGVDGQFSLNVSPGATLVISFIGYNTQEIKVENRTRMDVVLKDDTQMLEEVVVVGYGTMKKRDVLGSIATLKAADIMKTTPASIDAALQGMTSGVTVTSSGVPGAPVQVKVRGVSSISSGTDPLWIVDGIPITSGTLDKSYDGESGQNILSMINPSDIESIQVLKDAAATSIYGSRGSNGVIMVTTKSGRKGENTFDVDVRTGVSNWSKTDIGLATGREYVAIMDLVRANSRMNGLYDPVQSLGQLDNVASTMTREEAIRTNTDWADRISRTGNFIDARLAASNGSEKSNSYLSLNYRKDNSNFKFSDLQTLSANVNLGYKALESLTLGYRTLVSFTDNNRVKSGDGKQGAGGWAQVNSNALPWMKVYDPEGINGYWNPQSYTNALASIDPQHSESNLQSLNLISGVTADLALPVRGLSLKGEFGVNYVNSKGISWISKSVREQGARAREDKVQAITTNYNAYFNYDLNAGEAHSLNAVAGAEGTRSSMHTTALTGTGLVGVFHEIGTPNTLTGNSSLGNESYLLGLFGRANYHFMNKYYAGFSMRRDGISKFISENRWATFLSGSLGWIVSEESFFSTEAVNLFKLRGSYGQTGNTNIPTGITDDMWEIITGESSLQGTNSTSLINLGNTHIRWETTSTLDAGFDFGLFNNRITGSLAWYRQTVRDMLLQVSLPYSAGIAIDPNSIWQNMGDMTNCGWEFNVDAALIRRKDFRWSIGGNFSTNRNKVIALDSESDKNGVGIMQLSDAVADSEQRTLTKKGLPLGNWYMAEFAGVDPDKGIPLIYEVETLPDGSTVHTGRVIPGTTTNMITNRMILKGKTSIPKISGGFNTNVAYKGFDLNMVWTFAAGHYIYNRLRQSIMTPNTGLLALSGDILTDTWQQPGDRSKYPMTVYAGSYYYDGEGNPSASQTQYGSENKTPNTLYLEKGDYLRLKNVQVGYCLPDRIGRSLRMKSIRVYASGSNLLTVTGFSGYDPEVPVGRNSASSVAFFNDLPQARIFSLGISAKF
ncbi:MAG: TonB-dependent receptor [Tannerella sp.]|nr:TonB-dependent receptor [Tannerella sp.]